MLEQANAGYAATVMILTLGLLLSAVPLARRGAAGTLSWLLSTVVNESPSLGFAYLLVSTVPAVVGTGGLDPGAAGWFAVGCAGFVVSPVLLRRAHRAEPVLRRALDQGLGPGWREQAASAPWRRRLPWLRIVAFPLPVLPVGVRRRGVRYGPHRRHRLDVYGARRGPAHGRPVLVHLHGGGFRSGRRSVYSRPLLHAFARGGWLCVSPTYRLRPATYAEMLTDVKRAIAWTREHAADLGADPDVLVLAGSSAGAHLAITAALTADDERFQAGFEGADTSVTAAIGLYGYYGQVDRGGPPSQPSAYVHAAAPPIMIVHGDQDTLVPPEGARRLAVTLAARSAGRVVHAELPGAQHSFDLVHSLRFEQVVDALWCFCGWARGVARTPAPGVPPHERLAPRTEETGTGDRDG